MIFGHLSSSSSSAARSATFPALAFLPTLTSVLLLLSIHLGGGAHAAITTAVNRNNDYVEENASGQMCFYPKAADPSALDVACVGGAKGDYAAVMGAHLNLTTSINYFSGSLERLGGPEWVFNANGRRIYLCLTGRAGDYTYQTMCTTVGRDNSLGNATTPMCKVAAGQRRVTDGCYVPNQEAPALTVSSSTRSAVVTVTRTSTPATSTVTRSGAETGTSENSTSGVENAGSGLSGECGIRLRADTKADSSGFVGYMFLGGVNLAIYSTVFTLFWL